LQQIKSKCKIISITGTTNSLHIPLRMQCIIDYRLELQVVITIATIRLKHTTQNARDVSIDMIIDYYTSLQFILLLATSTTKQTIVMPCHDI
jgi:hypothetical protein